MHCLRWRNKLIQIASPSLLEVGEGTLLPVHGFLLRLGIPSGVLYGTHPLPWAGCPAMVLPRGAVKNSRSACAWLIQVKLNGFVATEVHRVTRAGLAFMLLTSPVHRRTHES